MPHYQGHDLISDLIAGRTAGLVAPPLAMAFGIASDVTPQAGICKAILTAFLASALVDPRSRSAGPPARSW